MNLFEGDPKDQQQNPDTPFKPGEDQIGYLGRRVPQWQGMSSESISNDIRGVLDGSDQEARLDMIMALSESVPELSGVPATEIVDRLRRMIRIRAEASASVGKLPSLPSVQPQSTQVRPMAVQDIIRSRSSRIHGDPGQPGTQPLPMRGTSDTDDRIEKRARFQLLTPLNARREQLRQEMGQAIQPIVEAGQTRQILEAQESERRRGELMRRRQEAAQLRQIQQEADRVKMRADDYMTMTPLQREERVRTVLREERMKWKQWARQRMAESDVMERDLREQEKLYPGGAFSTDPNEVKNYAKRVELVKRLDVLKDARDLYKKILLTAEDDDTAWDALVKGGKEIMTTQKLPYTRSLEAYDTEQNIAMSKAAAEGSQPRMGGNLEWAKPEDWPELKALEQADVASNSVEAVAGKPSLGPRMLRTAINIAADVPAYAVEFGTAGSFLSPASSGLAAAATAATRASHVARVAGALTKRVPGFVSSMERVFGEGVMPKVVNAAFGAGNAMVKAGAQTLMNPAAIAADVTRRMRDVETGELSPDMKDIINVTIERQGDDFERALLKSLAVSYVNNLSEYSGEGTIKLTKALGKAGMNRMRDSMIGRYGQEIGKILATRLGPNWAQRLKPGFIAAWMQRNGVRNSIQAAERFKKAIHWDGIIPEVTEELNVMPAENLIEGRPLLEGFNPENIATIAAGIGIFGMVGGLASKVVNSFAQRIGGERGPSKEFNQGFYDEVWKEIEAEASGRAYYGQPEPIVGQGEAEAQGWAQERVQGQPTAAPSVVPATEPATPSAVVSSEAPSASAPTHVIAPEEARPFAPPDVAQAVSVLSAADRAIVLNQLGYAAPSATAPAVDLSIAERQAPTHLVGVPAYSNVRESILEDPSVSNESPTAAPADDVSPVFLTPAQRQQIETQGFATADTGGQSAVQVQIPAEMGAYSGGNGTARIQQGEGVRQGNAELRQPAGESAQGQGPGAQAEAGQETAVAPDVATAGATQSPTQTAAAEEVTPASLSTPTPSEAESPAQTEATAEAVLPATAEASPIAAAVGTQVRVVPEYGGPATNAMLREVNGDMASVVDAQGRVTEVPVTWVQPSAQVEESAASMAETNPPARVSEVVEGPHKDYGDADMIIYMSPGVKGNQYGLWVGRRKENGSWDHQYVSNVGRSTEGAAERARQIAQKLSRGETKGINFLGTGTFDIPRKIHVSTDITTREDLDEASRIPIEQQRVGFGKYADVPVSELYDTDPEYAKWIVDAGSTNRARQIAAYLEKGEGIQQYRAQQKAEEDALAAQQQERDRAAEEAAGKVDIPSTLKKFGIETVSRSDGNGLGLRGNTFKHKDAIKRVPGARFVDYMREWQIPAESLNYLIAELTGTPVAEAPMTAEEEASPEGRLKRSGIQVGKPSAKGMVPLRGKTYDNRETIKRIPGAEFSSATREWMIPQERISDLADIMDGGTLRGEEKRELRRDESATAADIRQMRREADERDDNGAFTGKVDDYVGKDTQELINRGAKYDIPADVLAEQREDVARISKAYREKEPLFILASQPGSGKTFVLGGAIREMQRAGAKDIVYVTLRQELITQIKEDLKDYGIDDVRFMTYSEMRTARPQDTDVIIFDEGHSIKNVKEGNAAQQAKAASEWIAQSGMTILSTATPFENPVQMKYLEPSGIFDKEFGTFENFAIAFGASTKTIRTKYETTKRVVEWKRTPTSTADAKAANAWMRKRGAYTSRDIRLPENQVDSRHVKVQANEADARRYSLFSDIVAEVEGHTDLPSVTAMWITNFEKRLLEASKIDAAVQEAEAAIERGRNPIIFVETKAQRAYNIPELIIKEEQYQAQQMQTNVFGERESGPSRSDVGLPPEGIVPILERYMKKSGEEVIEIPSAEDAIIEHFGADNVSVFTGSVTPAKAQKNLDAWRSGERKVLVATMAKGGTGLSLHDKTGTHPTAQINVNLPWTATQIAQVTQRSARYGLKGKAEIEWLFADNIPYDRMLAARVGQRMADMGASAYGDIPPVAGRIENWDMEDRAFGEIKKDVAAYQSSVRRGEGIDARVPQQIVDQVRDFFGGRIPDNVQFVQNRGEAFDGRALKENGRWRIELNTEYLDPAKTDIIIAEELIHVLDFTRPGEFRSQLEDLYDAIPDEVKGDIERVIQDYYRTDSDAVQWAERRAKAVREMVAAAKQHQGFWEKFVELIRGALEKLGLMHENAEEMAKRLLEAAATNFVGVDRTNLNTYADYNNFLGTTGLNPAKFNSIHEWKQERDAVAELFAAKIRSLEKPKGMTEKAWKEEIQNRALAEAENFFSSLGPDWKSYRDYMLENADFYPVMQTGTLPSNSDPTYKVTVDLVGACVRMLRAIAIHDYVKSLGYQLDSETARALEVEMNARGHELTCLYCYVYTRRAASSAKVDEMRAYIRNGIIPEVEDAPPKDLEKRAKWEVKKRKVAQAYQAAITEAKKNPGWEKDFDALPEMLQIHTIAETKKNKKDPTLKDVSKLGAAFAQRYPAIWALKEATTNPGNMRVPGIELAMAGQIATLSKDKVEALKQWGGLRWQSNMDYSPISTWDYVQGIVEMNLAGVPGHSYTKQLAMVRLMRDSGLKMNISIAPKMRRTGKKDVNGRDVYEMMFDKSGKILLDTGSGTMSRADVDESLRLAPTHAGTMMLCLNDYAVDYVVEHALMYGIPLHFSGMQKSISDQFHAARGADDYRDPTERIKSYDNIAAIPKNLRSLATEERNKSGNTTGKLTLDLSRIAEVYPELQWVADVYTEQQDAMRKGKDTSKEATLSDIQLPPGMIIDQVNGTPDDVATQQYFALLGKLDLDPVHYEYLERYRARKGADAVPKYYWNIKKHFARTDTPFTAPDPHGIDYDFARAQDKLWQEMGLARAFQNGVGSLIDGYKQRTLSAKEMKDAKEIMEKISKLDKGKRVETALNDVVELNSRVAPKDTPEFKRWFGDSKITDQNGDPLVMYHGTVSDFDTFSNDANPGRSESSGYYGRGYYFAADPSTAGTYAREWDDGANIVPVALSISNPLELVESGSANMDSARRMTRRNVQRLLGLDGWTEGERAQLQSLDYDESPGSVVGDERLTTVIQANGYDGVAVRTGDGAVSMAVAFAPTQIKSTTGNRGTFDTEDPNILYSRVLPETIDVNGTARPTVNSDGRQLAGTEEGVRNFWNFFGKSAAVDARGRPVVLYHGTNADFDAFQKSKVGELGPGVYLTDAPHEAEEYSASHPNDGGASIMPVYVRINKPYTKGTRAFWDEFGADGDGMAIQNAMDAGYDGIIDTRKDTYYDNKTREFVDRGTSVTHYVAFQPRQIKSATGNDGQFSTDTPNILHSRVQTDSPEFKKWFGASKVVDENGEPLVVYRGEHGRNEATGRTAPSAPRTSAAAESREEIGFGDQFQTRSAALSFGSKDAANIYAEEPNDRGDTPYAPRVFPAYLRIESPIVDDPGDPFIDLGRIEDALGKSEAMRIAKKFEDDIKNTNNWEEIVSEVTGGEDVGISELLKQRPEILRSLYFDAYKYLDDASEVEQLKRAGFDGAIHGGNGETAGDAEYKVFSPTQIKSATGNRGTFDAEDPDILHSKAPSTRLQQGQGATLGEVIDQWTQYQAPATTPVPSRTAYQRARDASAVVRAALEKAFAPKTVSDRLIVGQQAADAYHRNISDYNYMSVQGLLEIEDEEVRRLLEMYGRMEASPDANAKYRGHEIMRWWDKQGRHMAPHKALAFLQKANDEALQWAGWVANWVRMDDTGKLTFGGRQRWGVLDRRTVKDMEKMGQHVWPGLILPDNRIVGEMSPDGDYQLYREMDPQKAQEFYDSFVKDFPEAVPYLTEYITAHGKIEHLASLGHDLPLVPFNRQEMTRYLEQRFPPAKDNQGNDIPGTGFNGVENYVHSLAADRKKALGLLGGVLRKRKADIMKHNAGVLNEMRRRDWNLSRSQTLARENFLTSEMKSEMAGVLTALVAKPLKPGGVPDDGYVKLNLAPVDMRVVRSVFAKSKTFWASKGVDVKEVIAGTYQLDAHWQIPAALQDELVGMMHTSGTMDTDPDLRKARDACAKIFNGLVNSINATHLIRPGTATTNLFSGELQLQQKTMTDIVYAIISGGSSDAWIDVKNDFASILRRVSPKAREEFAKVFPKEALMALDKTFYQDMGNIKGEDVTSKLLIPFQSIDVLYKMRVYDMVLHAEAERAARKNPAWNNSNDAQKKALISKSLANVTSDMLEKARKASDQYTYIYDDIPRWLQALKRKTWFRSFLPYPTYSYKFGSQLAKGIWGITGFIPEGLRGEPGTIRANLGLGKLGPKSEWPADTRVLRAMKALGYTPKHLRMIAQFIATGGSIASGAMMLGGSDDDKKRFGSLGAFMDPDGNLFSESFADRKFDVMNRFLAYDTDDAFYYLRAIKYPFVREGMALRQALEGNFNWGDYFGDMISEGSLFAMGVTLLGYDTKYTQSRPLMSQLGERIAQDIPFAPYLNDIATLIDPKLRVSSDQQAGGLKNLWMGFSSKMPFLSLLLEAKYDPQTGKERSLPRALTAWNFVTGLRFKAVMKDEQSVRENWGRMQMDTPSAKDPAKEWWYKGLNPEIQTFVTEHWGEIRKDIIRAYAEIQKTKYNAVLDANRRAKSNGMKREDIVPIREEVMGDIAEEIEQLKYDIVDGAILEARKRYASK